MFDYIKFKIENQETINHLYDHDKLTFTKSVSTIGKNHTIVTNTKKHLNMLFEFKIIEGYIIDVTIKGSIHYFYNNGRHNANVFTFKDFKDSLYRLRNLFNIDLKDTVLLPCEYGFNLKFNNQDKVIFNCMSENRKMFRQNVAGKPSVISGGCNSDYQMKIYNKTEQFKQFNYGEILRIENKNNRSRSWNKKEIKTVQDLVNTDNNHMIFNQFLERFKGIILYDVWITPKRKNKGAISLYSNINFWRELVRKGGQNKDYNYQKKLLENLSDKEGNSIKNKLQLLIENQYIHNYGLCHVIQGIKKNILTNAQLYKSTNARKDKVCIVENKQYLVNRFSNGKKK